MSPVCGRPAAGYLYGAAFAFALRRAKFGRQEGIFRTLLRGWIQGEGQAHFPKVGPHEVLDGIAYVPSAWPRRFWRGYELPLLIAQVVAKEHKVPLFHALKTCRHDAPFSHGMDKEERQQKVAGRFQTRIDVADRSILLVDDVFTTGATLKEAKRTLEDAGATVRLFALAQKP